MAIPKSNINTKIREILEKKEGKKDENEDSNISSRDKKKELITDLETLKNELSSETLKTIKNNPDKMKEIINGLKKKGISGKELDIELEKFTSKIKNRDRELTK